jgi:hypothetical protein
MKIADAPSPGGAVKPPAPTPARPHQLGVATALSGRMTGDRREVAPRVARLFAPPTPPAPYRPAGLPPAEQQAAEQTIALASDGRNAEPVVRWLESHPDPAARDQFLDLMFQFESVAGEILNNTQRLGDTEKALLAQALDHAYESGAVTADELRASVERGGCGAPPWDNHLELAEIVGLTGNPDLIATYAAREIEILQASPEEAARAQAVATALGAMPPGALQGFLAQNAEGVRAAIGFVNADPDAAWSPALGNLLRAAAAIQPPTSEALAVFDASVAQIGENTDSRQQAAAFFTRNFDAIVRFYQADSAKLGLEGQRKLSVFFARTLFTEPSYEGQEAFRQALTARLGSLSQSLDAHAGENPPAIAAQRDAQLLGSLVGTIEGGFHIAVDELGQRNEAVAEMVDFLFKGAGLLPDVSLPGFGLLKDLTVDQVKEWVTQSLQEKPRDASEALPFHAVLGEEIDSVALVTIYDAARSEAFTNRGVGLVR